MTNLAIGEGPGPRVFVSSVIEDFDDYRAAARRGIKRAGCQPVLVNEDFPAAVESSRNVCLDAVDSCDVFLVIVGRRGDWKTPAGKLVVEEEYERAKSKKIPVLARLVQIFERPSGSAVCTFPKARGCEFVRIFGHDGIGPLVSQHHFFNSTRTEEYDKPGF